MKALEIIIKIVVALAAIAGIAFVIVKYGDKIVAWFKKHFSCCCGECDCTCCDCESDDVEAPAEEFAAEEDAAVATESDFEG